MQTFIPWVHVFAFSIWLGANLFVLGLWWPAGRGLPPGPRLEVLRRAAGGLNALVAAAAPVALVSGLAGAFIHGTAQFAPGSGAFLVVAAKAVLTAVMGLNHGLQAFRYEVSLEHPLDGRNPWMRLLVVNVALGVVVLLLGLSLRRLAL